MYWSTRTGRRARWSLFESPGREASFGHWFSVCCLLGFLVPVGFSLVLGWRGVQAMAEAVDPRAPVHTLQRMSPAGDGDPDRVYLSGTIADCASDQPALCLAVHSRVGERGGFAEDYRGTVNAGASLVVDGRAMTIVGPVTFEPTRFQSDVDIPHLRDMLRDMPRGGYVRAQCVSAGDRVFAEGCRETLPGGAEALTGCGGEPVILTPGDGTPAARVEQIAAGLAGRIFGFCAACVLLLAYGWRVVAASPLLKAMAGYSGHRPSSRAWALVGPTPILAASLCIGTLTLLGPFAEGTTALQHSLASFGVLAAVAVFVASASERRRELRAAGALLSSPARAPLDQAAGGVVLLDVNVKRDHAVIRGPLTGEPRAFARVDVRDVARSGTGRRTGEGARPERSLATPDAVDFEHASGEGALELKEAEVDLPAVRCVVGPGGDAPRPDVFRELPSVDPSSSYEVEESYMEPGDPLFVVGTVKKTVPSAQWAGYREHAVSPILGKGKDAPLLVVAGTGDALRRELRLEARYLAVAMAVALVAGLIAGAQVCWLVR